MPRAASTSRSFGWILSGKAAYSPGLAGVRRIARIGLSGRSARRSNWRRTESISPLPPVAGNSGKSSDKVSGIRLLFASGAVTVARKRSDGAGVFVGIADDQIAESLAILEVFGPEDRTVAFDGAVEDHGVVPGKLVAPL